MLSAYSTFMVLAWVVAITLGTVVARRRDINWWRTLLIGICALAVGIVGARVLDLAVNWGYYAEDTSRILDISFRGFALYGGLFLALGAGLLLSRIFRLPIWRLLDSAVPALAAGIVLMRVGCFLNGCCFGTVTSLPWGVTFPPGSPAWSHQFATGQTGLSGLMGEVLPVHPTQIYEMLAAVVLGGLAMWLMLQRGPAGRAHGREERAGALDGVPFLVFALGFTAFRAFNHQLRAQLMTMTLPVSVYPTLYGLICAGLLTVLVWRLRQHAVT